MDPRGTTAKRQKWGRFLPHQRANVDQMHSSNYGPENEWVLLTMLSDHLRWCVYTAVS